VKAWQILCLMIVYKIKHKPTGLYFTPSKGYGNLSLNGKIYAKKPNLKWVGNSVRVVIKQLSIRKPNKREQLLIDCFKITKDPVQSYYWIDKYYSVPYEDWEIEEID
jgi:hypothetical protein